MQATITKQDAERELARFFALSVEMDANLTMFSDYVDQAWHDLMEDDATYAAFCEASCGRTLGHVPSNQGTNPIVVVEWVAEYEARYGDLPAVWFADEQGVLQDDAYQDYLDSHTIVAAWKCQPSTGSIADVESA